jgi:Tol biopolymer transport system component
MRRFTVRSIIVLALILSLLFSIGCTHVSPGKIAFISDREDPGHVFSIYVMDTDGSNRVRVASWCLGAVPESSFCWSPDATVLASVCSMTELCFAAADGTELSKVEVVEHMPLEVSWSPDGKRIVFTTGHLYAIDLETGELKQLTDIPGMKTSRTSLSWSLSWSPDGKRIAFLARNWFTPVPEDYEDLIYVIDADGSHLTQLTDEGFKCSDVSWSPNGKRIVYTAGTEETRRSDIYVIDVKSGSSINLTNSPSISDWDPSWSPDSKRIAFVSAPPTYPAKEQVYVIDADGSHLTQLTDEDFACSGVSWSPDGKRIAFTAFGSRFLDKYDISVPDIYVMDADGSNLTNLTGDILGQSVVPIWSPLPRAGCDSLSLIANLPAEASL